MISNRLKRKAIPYCLLIPAIILIGLFKIYPILYSIVGSFFKTGRGGVISFAGINNYLKELLHDPTVKVSWVVERVGFSNRKYFEKVLNIPHNIDHLHRSN